MKHLKAFEEFSPRRVSGRETVRKDLLKKEVENMSKEYQSKDSKYLESLLIDDIFFLWDRHVNDDREGIEHGLSGKHHVFFFDDNKSGYDNFLEHLTMFLNSINYSYELVGQKMNMFGFKKSENFEPRKLKDRMDSIVYGDVVEVDDGNVIEENVLAVAMLRDAKEIKNINIYNEDKDGGQRFCSADILTDVGLLKIDWQMGISNSLYNAMDGDGYEAVLKRLKRMAKINA